MQTRKVAFADALRGIAAVLVVISHYFGIFWYRRDVVATLTGLPAVSPSVPTPSYVDWLNPTSLPFWAGVGVGLFFPVSLRLRGLCAYTTCSLRRQECAEDQK